MTADQIINYFKGVTNAAKGIDVTRQTIAYWRREKHIPYKTQRRIEFETGGALKAQPRARQSGK